MPRQMQLTLITSLTKQIRQSQREVVILFTDIEGSTRYWDNRGNIKGRLMVDRHNRILTPIVRHFQGRVVKTIGDAVMAVFEQPALALRAATAMQQALAQERLHDSGFDIHIRIGLHVGDAVVERNDVFGDVVNVAARIVNEAQADEILISGRLARRLDKTQFRRNKKGGFTPKGKRRRIALYCCHWQQHEDLLPQLKSAPLHPLGMQQSIEVIGYLLAILAGLYLFHLYYLRYLLADNEVLALLLLNPGTMLWRYWFITLALLLLGATLVWRILRIKTIPTRLLKGVKGLASGTLLFILLYSLSGLLPQDTPLRFHHSLYTSQHLFVEVRDESASIRQAPDPQAQTMLEVNRNTLLLLSNFKRVGRTEWNKVLVDEGRYGWIERVRPASHGVAEKRISWTGKFSLRYGDLYMLLLALTGVIWGYRSFHVKPH